ncbi:MAG: AlpA family phage regulatory protein [Steroidobacteraceae bacterium]|nr:AlpA family phage regulatory protein [Steroidobacteraceae bacterium]
MDQPPTSLPTCDAHAARRELPSPAFFRIRDVLRITGLSRPTLYRRIAMGRFPPPVHLGGRACGWPSAALQAWTADPEGYRATDAPERAANRSRHRGRPRKYAN